mgnify:CR=1 FL=1
MTHVNVRPAKPLKNAQLLRRAGVTSHRFRTPILIVNFLTSYAVNDFLNITGPETKTAIHIFFTSITVQFLEFHNLTVTLIPQRSFNLAPLFIRSDKINFKDSSENFVSHFRPRMILISSHQLSQSSQ